MLIVFFFLFTNYILFFSIDLRLLFIFIIYSFLIKFFVLQVTHFRRKNKIFVLGSDVPEPIEKFEDLVSNYDCSQTLVDNISKLGYSAPTPIQMQAIPLMLYVS